MYGVTLTIFWRTFCWVLLLTCGGVQAADAGVPVPSLQARVTDLTKTLTASQQAQLEQVLGAFEAQKGSQIAVLIVPTTQPETIEQYGIRVGDAWKLGRRGVDDGAILLVAKDDRAMRIEVGYGLEGVLPDAVANRIVDEVIAPYFKQGDFYGGIQAGVERMLRVVEGESLPEPTRQPAAIGNLEQIFPFIFFAALIGGGLLRALLGRFAGALATGGLATLLAWWVLGSLLMAIIVGVIALVIVLSGGMGRGGGWYSGGGLGGGSLGGRGGGGFSGGGGGFGGGGASGRW